MLNILIVDDSRAARMMLAHWLKAVRSDCEIIEAAGSEEAERLAAGLPENTLVLLDYNMPGENGIELAKRLLPRFPARRMVLVTANIQEAVRKRAEELGLGYMAKPLNPAKVKEILASVEPSG